MDTPEHRALTHCYPRVYTCVEQSPDDIVAHLRPSGTLAPGDLSFLENPQNGNGQKAQKIINVVLNQVKMDPRVFNTFISALKGAGSWTKNIVNELLNNLCSATTSTSQTPLHVNSTNQKLI